MKPNLYLPLLLSCFLALGHATAADAAARPALFQIRAVAAATSDDVDLLPWATPAKTVATSEPLRVNRKVLLEASDIASARAQKDPVSGEHGIHLRFTKAGAKRFAEATRVHTGGQLAIVIDGKVVSAPKVMMELPGREAVISGNFSETEARQLATRLHPGK